MSANYPEIQELLQQRADIRARLNLMPYDGNPEIKNKAVGGLKGAYWIIPGPEAVMQFAEELRGYKSDKGTIRIPYGRGDAALVEKIAKWCWETGDHA